MESDAFNTLREQIRTSPVTMEQLVDLLGEVARRVCGVENAELEDAQHDLSEACEALTVARENAMRAYAPDEMELSRRARAAREVA